jgi:transposase
VLKRRTKQVEHEAGHNLECMWLTGKLAPDFKAIADFRRDHGPAIQAACRRFVLLCRNLGLIAGGTVAVDGSRLRAVNARGRNFTSVTIRRRMEQVDASIVRFLGMLDTADQQEGV